MKWYWKARIYSTDGLYAFVSIETDRDLKQIDIIQNFYKSLTKCKMIIEGMSETPYSINSSSGFLIVWDRLNLSAAELT